MFNFKNNNSDINSDNFILLRVRIFVNFLFAFFMVFLVSLVLQLLTQEKTSSMILTTHFTHYLIQTPGCKIPIIYSSTNNNFFKSKVKPIVCKHNNSTQPLVLSDQSSMWVDEDALRSYGINNTRSVMCCYSELYRPAVIGPNDTGPPYRYKRTCKSFWKRTYIYVEFVRINCTNNGTIFYTDFHSFVPIKEKIETRCENLNNKKDKLNVLILGLDSVSRLSFRRTMQKMYRYLEEIGAIEMVGYNKVGFGSAHNMLPVATGLLHETVIEKCVKRGNKFLDSVKFIWKDFETQGYRTAFIEDSEHGATFEHIGKGFSRAPTDYYSLPFYYAAETEIGNFKNKTNFCIGPRLLFKTLLTYAQKFIEAMADRSYFGLFWQCSLTHEGLNIPKLGDDSYLSFLKTLTSYKSFNKTVLIILSDHGFVRYFSYYKFTKLGRLEASTPLLFFLFPKWFVSERSAAVGNLRRNSRRLITPFDLHETLKDLTNHHYYLDNNAVEVRAGRLDKDNLPRGISLFLPIPESRTCEDAKIPFIYCTCEQNNTQDMNSEYKKLLAHEVINWINLKLSAYPQCILVKFHKVLYCTIGDPMFTKMRNTIIYNWYLVIETNGGAMTFEASGRIIDKVSSIVDTVNTISTYQYRSQCVDNSSVKPFCKCR